MSIDVVKIREFNGHSQAVYALSVSKDKSIFSGGGDGMLVKWQMSETDGVLLARCDAAVYAIACHGQFTLAGTQKGTLFVFDGAVLHRQIQVSDKPIYRIKYLLGFYILLSGDGCMHILNENFERAHNLPVSDKPLRSICRTESGFAVSGTDAVIRLFDRQFMLQSELPSASGEQTIFALAYAGKTGRLYSGGRDAMLRTYEANRLASELPAHLLHIHDLALNQDESRLLSSGMDKTIKLWDTESGALLKVIDFAKHGAHRSSVNKILWFDKNTIISCSDDRTLMCFDLQEKQ